METERPIQVEITNRGEGAATGPGLVLGFIGVMSSLILIAALGVVLIAAMVPMLLTYVAFWALRVTVRLDVRYGEWVDEVGFVDHK